MKTINVRALALAALGCLAAVALSMTVSAADAAPMLSTVFSADTAHAVYAAGGVAFLASSPFNRGICFDANGGGGGATKTAAELATEVKKDFDTKFDKLKEIATDALGRAEKGEGLSAGAKQTADEALTAVNEAKARLDEMEQKMVRASNTDKPEVKSLGQFVTDRQEVKNFLANPRGRVSVETKAIISSLTTDADGSAGDLIEPLRVPGIVQPALRRMTVRDLLSPGRTNSSAIQYVKESGYTNSAATVTETAGTAKPQSEIKFEVVNGNVTTIAHWVKATRQILDDVPMLQSYINDRLIYGLKYVEDNQLLNGGGTGTDLNGIYTQATASTANLAVVATPTWLDVLRAAMLQAALANIPPTGIVLHPTDWFKIETTKDTAGAYIIGNPAESIQPRVWGLPVVETAAMTVDKFLVGAFKGGAQIFDRWDARVEISTEDSDNFQKNLVTILAEERLALAVYNTLAFVKGDFSDQVTDLTS